MRRRNIIVTFKVTCNDNLNRTVKYNNFDLYDQARILNLGSSMSLRKKIEKKQKVIIFIFLFLMFDDNIIFTGYAYDIYT